MADGKIPEEFEVGEPVLVCRWRLYGAALPAANRHMKALGRREVTGKPLSKQLLAWAKQHIEWTLADGAAEHPDGVLLLMVDDQGRAAMAAGDYEPLANTSLPALLERAQAAGKEAAQTGVAPEAVWAVRGDSLICGVGVGEPLSGASSLVRDLAATLGASVERSASLADDLAAGEPCDEAFLVSDEHGVVCAEGASGPMGEQFARGWQTLLERGARR